MGNSFGLSGLGLSQNLEVNSIKRIRLHVPPSSDGAPSDGESVSAIKGEELAERDELLGERDAVVTQLQAEIAALRAQITAAAMPCCLC